MKSVMPLMGDQCRLLEVSTVGGQVQATLISSVAVPESEQSQVLEGASELVVGTEIQVPNIILVEPIGA